MANIYDDPEIMFHEETELSKDTNTLRAEKDQLVFECIKTRAELDEAKAANRAWAAYGAKLDANLAEAKEENANLEHEANRMKQYANLYKLKAKQLGWCVSHSDHQDVYHGDDMPKGLTQSELIN